jgi:hypothetical protein
MLASFFLAPILNTIPRNQIVKGETIMATNLHSVDKNCGIDTDAGMSISTIRADFPWLNETNGSAIDNPTPAGISGGESKVGGMGPMIVRSKSGEYLIDPEAIYIEPGEKQPNFRVLSAQRLKANGVRLVQCFNNSDTDVLQDRRNYKTLKLSEEGPKDKKILVLETVPCDLKNKRVILKTICDDIQKGNRTAMVPELSYSKEVKRFNLRERGSLLAPNGKAGEVTTMIFNEAKLNEQERSRLYVRRLGYCNSELFR